MTILNLADVRREYESEGMTKKLLNVDPVKQFEFWLTQAREQKLLDATAMTLSTATLSGRPSARVVLLKNIDDFGFCWYGDSRSQKGSELEENPQASLLFYWRDFSRQVRIQGVVEKLPVATAEDYFNSRPQTSRFSAAASLQSADVESRKALEAQVTSVQQAYPDGNVPRPKAWVGYRLKPDYFEFWQGQVSRLHDRIVYTPTSNGWAMKRISP